MVLPSLLGRATRNFINQFSTDVIAPFPRWCAVQGIPRPDCLNDRQDALSFVGGSVVTVGGHLGHPDQIGLACKWHTFPDLQTGCLDAGFTNEHAQREGLNEAPLSPIVALFKDVANSFRYCHR